jgi:hypothetical protein
LFTLKKLLRAIDDATKGATDRKTTLTLDDIPDYRRTK